MQRHYIFDDIYLLMCIGDRFFSCLMRNIYARFETIHAVKKSQGIRVKSKSGKQLIEDKLD